MTESGIAAAGVTRVARRRALPGHEEQYEALVREMFALMQKRPGFLGAELIPPLEAGGHYQVIVNFASEDQLAGWDNSRSRSEILARMQPHAEGEPEHRRLSGLEAWFSGAVVPATMHPPKHRMAFVTWLGIWPTATLAIMYLTPVFQAWHFPFLLITAINTILITAAMTYLVMPRLTRWMKPFLRPKAKK